MTDEIKTSPPSIEARERRAYLWLAIAIAATVIVGFGLNAGRYNFNPSVFPAHVLLHGLVFLAWVALYVVQCVLVVTGRVAWHRRLGVAGAALAVMMLGLGLYTTILCLQRGAVPPFFSPALFLAIDGLGIILFFVLVAAAILLRRRSDWHKRLMVGAMIQVTSPALGRILPMPLLGDMASWAVYAAMMVFWAVAAWFDLRERGRVHPALLVVGGVLTILQILLGPIAGSPAIAALVQFLTSA